MTRVALLRWIRDRAALLARSTDPNVQLIAVEILTSCDAQLTTTPDGGGRCASPAC